MVLFIIPPFPLVLFTHHHIHLIVVKGGQCVFGLRQTVPDAHLQIFPKSATITLWILLYYRHGRQRRSKLSCIRVHQSVVPECSPRTDQVLFGRTELPLSLELPPRQMTSSKVH